METAIYKIDYLHQVNEHTATNERAYMIATSFLDALQQFYQQTEVDIEEYVHSIEKFCKYEEGKEDMLREMLNYLI